MIREILYGDSPVSRKAADIPVGITFLGSIGDYIGLFLRAPTDIVLLHQTPHTWTLGVDVQYFQEVDVEIRILPKEEAE